MCVKMGKIVMISDDFCKILRLLLLMIIVNSKNWTILIIVKENITVNRQKPVPIGLAIMHLVFCHRSASSC